jgi:hypothetical protein
LNNAPAMFTVLNFPVGDVDLAVNEVKKGNVRLENYDLGDLKTGKKGSCVEMVRHYLVQTPGNILSVIQQTEHRDASKTYKTKAKKHENKRKTEG